MARERNIPGCDRTSRWFGDRYVGTAQGDVLEKLVLHSTETDKRWGCPGYQLGGTAPTVTINPWPGYRERWQHFTADRSARALLNPSSTAVSENKDRVAQIEIIGYSDPNLGKSRGCYLPDLDDAGLAYIAETVRWYSTEYGIKLVRPATWPWYRVNNEAAFAAARMTSSQYDRFAGVLAHLHVSGNAHRDVAIDIDRLLTLARGKAGPGGSATNPTSGGSSGGAPSPEEDDVSWNDQLPVLGSDKKQTAGYQLTAANVHSYRADKKLDRVLAQLEAVTAVMETLASNQGADPAQIAGIVDKAVRDRLAKLTLPADAEVTP